MSGSPPTLEVYLEIGSKRTFAGVIAWPGWCRSGRDETAALQALAAAGPRYARVLQGTPLELAPELASATFVVAERLAGTSTTDFGAPDLAPSSDAQPLAAPELSRLQTLLQACWAALDSAAGAAEGVPLRVGPRGGGRDREGVLRHVLEAEQGYLAQLGGRRPSQDGGDLTTALARTRQAVLEALAAAARGELPAKGPRGGARWPPRYFVRRAAWHVLDHTWELEDRAGQT